MKEEQKPTNRIEEMLKEFPPNGPLDQLERKLEDFGSKNLSREEKETWHRLYGICAFRQGKRNAAFERFMEGARQCPDSPDIAFSLGQEYEFRGDIDKMLICFDRAIFPKVSSSFALAQARYCYLWNEYEKGIHYIKPFINIYLDLGILDDTFLHIRGLPFFSRAWSYFAAFYKLSGRLSDLKDLTYMVIKKCPDYDFEYLNAELEGLAGGDFSSLKEILRKKITKAQKEDFPYGYSDLRLHILEAQSTEDLSKAEDLLNRPKFQERDFPWLEDMRLLALCELEKRRGNAEKERELQQEFLKKQSILFEPDHAMSFNLLSYQECLKLVYISNRKPQAAKEA